MADYLVSLKQLKKRKCLAALILSEVLDDSGDQKARRGKTRQWIRRRNEKGHFENIVKELMIEDTAGYKEMMRMNYDDFTTILGIIEPYITPKQILGGTKVIKAPERLTLAIRFLATGETYRSLSFQFRISVSAICYIVRQVFNAMKVHFVLKYVRIPSTDEEWMQIADKFEKKWNFPNCVGAVDGKHVVMQSPANAGSHYYNYKGTHSIVLMAVAGPDYECVYADVGTNGRVSDGGVWNKCGLMKAIEVGTVVLPPPKCLPFGVKKLPYVFVGDDAFALKKHMMKPYPQHDLTEDKRVYNYRHSRARRISENLFGILANRWRVFRSVLLLPPDTIELLVFTALGLHNFLRQSSSCGTYCPVGLVDQEQDGQIIPGIWRQESPAEAFSPLNVPSTGHNASTDAKSVRETLKEYFFNEGSVDWQWDMC